MTAIMEGLVWLPTLISFNYSIVAYPASAQNSVTQLKDFMPLIYVSLGAIIAFIGNYIMETYKRKYELKKQTYLEALNLVVKTDRIYKGLFEDGMEVYKWMDKLDMEPYRSWSIDYELLMFKLDICKGEKVKKQMQSICDRPFIEGVESLDKLYNDLKEVMKDELNKPWWKFW